jgi:hypothetical protein
VLLSYKCYQFYTVAKFKIGDDSGPLPAEREEGTARCGCCHWMGCLQAWEERGTSVIALLLRNLW